MEKQPVDAWWVRAERDLLGASIGYGVPLAVSTTDGAARPQVESRGSRSGRGRATLNSDRAVVAVDTLQAGCCPSEFRP